MSQTKSNFVQLSRLETNSASFQPSGSQKLSGEMAAMANVDALNSGAPQKGLKKATQLRTAFGLLLGLSLFSFDNATYANRQQQLADQINDDLYGIHDPFLILGQEEKEPEKDSEAKYEPIPEATIFEHNADKTWEQESTFSGEQEAGSDQGSQQEETTEQAEHPWGDTWKEAAEFVPTFTPDPRQSKSKDKSLRVNSKAKTQAPVDEEMSLDDWDNLFKVMRKTAGRRIPVKPLWKNQTQTRQNIQLRTFQQIFDQVNECDRGARKLHKIDLHRNAKKEALARIESEINLIESGLASSFLEPNVGNGEDHIFYVICGAGTHSANSRGVLKHAVR